MKDQNEVEQASDVTRRNFLKGLMGGAGAAAAVAAFETLADNPAILLAQDAATEPASSGSVLSSAGEGGPVDVLERMRLELQRALQKSSLDRALGDGHRPAQVCGLPCLHNKLCCREQTPPRRRLSPSDRRGMGNLSQCRATICTAPLYAVRESALCAGLPGRGNIYQ